MTIIVAIIVALLGFAAGSARSNRKNNAKITDLTNAHEAEIRKEIKKAFQHGWNEAGRSAGYVHDCFYKIFPPIK